METLKNPDYFSVQIHRAKRFQRIANIEKEQICTKLQVISGGRESCSPGYHISRKTFPYHTIEFVVRGHGILVLNDTVWDLNPGTVFFYSPGIPHEIRNTFNDPLEKYFINISGSKAVKLIEKKLSLSGKAFQTSASHSLIRTFEEIIQYGLEYSPWCSTICSNLVEVLIYKIAKVALPAGKGNIDQDSEAYRTFLKCWNYISTHYLDHRTLSSFSEKCGITESYMCRLFKEFDRQSPYQCLLRLQMNYAADRLRDEKISIHKIAEELGFKEPQHFSRTFKKILGQSPTKFIL